MPAMDAPEGLRHGDPHAWDRLIDAVGPSAMLVRVEAALGARFRGQVGVDEIWRETLLRTWRVRESLDWSGLPAFRRQLLAIAEEVIKEQLEDGEGGRVTPMPRRSSGSVHAGPIAFTSPARASADREEAFAMRYALDRLSPEFRYVVWLSEFEELSPQTIAERLELDLPEVQDRLRRGTIAFRHKLRTVRQEKAAEPTEETWF